jgi:hypothetical protein
MKRLISVVLLIFACLALGGLFIVYNNSENFSPDDEPIRAIEP